PLHARAQRRGERVQIAIDGLQPLEHLGGRLGDSAHMLARLSGGLRALVLGPLGRFHARALGHAQSLLPELARLLFGPGSDLRGALLCSFDDAADLLGDRCRYGLSRPLRALLERLDLAGDLGEVCVDCGRVIAAAADGEILLLDAVSLQGHANYLSLTLDDRTVVSVPN